MVQKRAAAIHEISGFGKCSLTVALPILSACGIETAVIPTAVLSTHTGGFKDYTFRDLTDDILPIAEHWKKNNLKFDALYSGYLGSKDQIEIMKKVFKMLKGPNTLVAVDPVMADNGKLYGGFPDEFPSLMKELCGEADLITPNITEASFMLGREYKEGPYNKEQIEELLSALMDITPGSVILTGVFFEDKRLGAACLNRGSGKISYSFSDRVDALYHGTGDTFTSAAVAALINGKSLERAMEIAVDYTYRCIKDTKENYPDMWYGVNFEGQLPHLMKLMEE